MRTILTVRVVGLGVLLIAAGVAVLWWPRTDDPLGRAAPLTTDSSLATTASPATPSIEAPAEPTTDLAQLRSRVESELPATEQVESVSVDAVARDEIWIVVSMHALTGRDEAVEGFIAIGKWTGVWTFALPGDPNFYQWLEELPPSVLDPAAKAWFRR